MMQQHQPQDSFGSTFDFSTDKGSYSIPKQALIQYVEKAFLQEKKSFLLLPIPSSQDFIPFSVMEQIAKESESVRKQMEIVLQTVPEQNDSLSDFHYTFGSLPDEPSVSYESDPNAYVQDLALLTNDTPGLFVNDIDGGKFHFVSQRHYDAVGDFVCKYVQEELLVKRCKLDEYWLPLDMNAQTQKDQMVNIFMSKDALTNPNKLMLLIQGSGAVRPGQWARALCMNDTLKTGTQYNYIVQAMKEGYGVIVFNPNQNHYVPKELDDPTKYNKTGYMNRNKPEPLPKNVKKSIPHNQSPPEHTVYVWDHFVKKAAAKDVVIVAHSAGGWCTMELLKERTQECLNRVRAIAFTDSVHSVNSSDPKPVRDFVVANAVNWVTSEKQCDVLVSPKRQGSSCECRSAGHNKHEYTSEFCREAAFSYINAKLAQ
ncbi:hypothetical protein NAEGRDRAFT_81892 [Naegleria gruberi]|uniref:Uncharacterized protein AM53 n=1 Tax=Naegleria gruberi TaxID=5762 RepID=D2W043_NAEGR|nr:uncharacterized protein NAEGRDRAFT_81892 [Naegleria gruberi]EFC37510.1 hypothetical protein NAEGRDRAFT_81892 [Naegleria gruberi]|eukprot:XP_002670254.1 hypothetical protein NAEGRDRAFT_81892 [Naegleria gruberi strain NEG-M]